MAAVVADEPWEWSAVGVTYSVDDKVILDDVYLTVPPGKVTAIMGPRFALVEFYTAMLSLGLHASVVLAGTLSWLPQA